jgi:hypothetical protein
VGVRLGSGKTMVQVVNGWRVDSWDLWCRVVVGVVGVVGSYVVVMVVDNDEWRRWWRDMIM